MQDQMNQMISSCILATDMRQHVRLLDAARMLAATEPDSKTHLEDQDAVLYGSFMLHCADLSNPAKPWLIAEHWSRLIMQYVNSPSIC